MHCKDSGTTQQTGQGSAAEAGLPARTMVRSLLGLPERVGSKLYGYAPVPPVSFRYPMQSAAKGSFSSSDLATDHSAAMANISGQQEIPSPTFQHHEFHHHEDERPAAEDLSAMPHPSAKTEESPPAADYPRPGPDKAGQHARLRPPAPEMGWAAIRPTDLQANDRQQATAEIGKVAARENETTPAAGKEMAIPGRSIAKQVFASPAPADKENLVMAGQVPGNNHSNGQTGRQPSQEYRDKRAATELSSNVSEPHRADVSAQSSLYEENGMGLHAHQQHEAEKLPTVVRPAGLEHQPPSTELAAERQQTTSATGQRNYLAPGRSHKTVDGKNDAEIPASLSELKTTAVPPDRWGYRSALADRPAVSPARLPDEEGARQIAELRRTFYELIAKKTAAETKDNEQTTTSAGHQTPAPPPLQQVVVINRISGSRSRVRLPAAFWERSCMARMTLKMIR